MTKASTCPSLALVALLALCQAVSAAGFSIDPDPASPTLGELVDREAGPVRVLRGPVVERNPATITRVPAMPREAVTVIVPGRRLR